MLKGNVPYREGLELGVAGANPALVLMINLRETGGQFSAAGSRSGDDYQRFRSALSTARESLGAENLAEILRAQIREELRNPTRPPDEAKLAEDLEAFNTPYISMDLDEAGKTAEVSILGLFSTKAVYRPGLGCTLCVEDVDAFELQQQADHFDFVPINRDAKGRRAV